MTLSDTPGEGLTYGQKLIAEAIEHHFGERIEHYDEDADDTCIRDAWEAFDSLTASPSVGSDTAGPSDHAGMVERVNEIIEDILERHAEKHPSTDELADYMRRIPEAIAALSRAPEAAAVDDDARVAKAWKTLVAGGWTPPTRPSDALTVALATSPPAPQPAIALIEELTETLRRVRKRVDVIEPNDSAEIPYWNGQHEQARGMIDTALASAKRFRTGE